MSNKTYIADRIAWLEWLEANGLDRDQTVSPEKFPCVAALGKAELGLLGGTANTACEGLTITCVSYVYLDDFLPF